MDGRPVARRPGGGATGAPANHGDPRGGGGGAIPARGGQHVTVIERGTDEREKGNLGFVQTSVVFACMIHTKWLPCIVTNVRRAENIFP